MMFEFATRKKLRFPYKGQISVEDLWDLSLEKLDEVFKTLNKEYKTHIGEESLLTEVSADVELETKIEIVKHIVAVKKEERDQRQAALEMRERKQRIMEVINQKKDKALYDMSVEELEKLL